MPLWLSGRWLGNETPPPSHFSDSNRGKGKKNAANRRFFVRFRHFRGLLLIEATSVACAWVLGTVG